jgi:hypothetical protein
MLLDDAEGGFGKGASRSIIGASQQSVSACPPSETGGKSNVADLPPIRHSGDSFSRKTRSEYGVVDCWFV